MTLVVRVRGASLDGNTLVAVCATVIALVSLAVSVHESRAARRHNRLSVRPLLQFQQTWQPGKRSGLKLTNSGLGPAVIVKTVLSVDGNSLGEYNKPNVDVIRDMLPFRPTVITFAEKGFTRTDFDAYLLSVPVYDPESHGAFKEMLTQRVSLEIWYESLYGGEGYKVTVKPGEVLNH
ncbi:hypothetical protein [Streptomyces sp. NEAU-S77]|uniref:hypothetical protein n=1 Tax=Streptomyces sp. NEAU-S77 TaxID=3411033 RepID=UPI003B9F5545